MAVKLSSVSPGSVVKIPISNTDSSKTVNAVFLEYNHYGQNECALILDFAGYPHVAGVRLLGKIFTSDGTVASLGTSYEYSPLDMYFLSMKNMFPDTIRNALIDVPITVGQSKVTTTTTSRSIFAPSAAEFIGSQTNISGGDKQNFLKNGTSSASASFAVTKDGTLISQLQTFVINASNTFSRIVTRSTVTDDSHNSTHSSTSGYVNIGYDKSHSAWWGNSWVTSENESVAYIMPIICLNSNLMVTSSSGGQSQSPRQWRVTEKSTGSGIGRPNSERGCC